MRTLLPHPDLRDIALRPSATARVWLGAGAPLETVAVPGVGLGAGDVLVAVELSTISPADVLIHTGRLPARAPLVLGQESVGRVIAIGDGGADAVDGSELRIGDRIVWSSTLACGACDRCVVGLGERCRAAAVYGRERLEPRWELTGGFASHVHLRRGTAIVRCPESLPAAVLAPATATAAAWTALRRAGRDLDGIRVRVHGADLVGLTVAAIAADQGALVDVVDPDATRMRLAERFGAVPAGQAAPAVAIVTAADAVAEAYAGVAAGGTVVLTGDLHRQDGLVADPGDFVDRLITVAGAGRGSAADLRAAVSFLAGRGRAHPFDQLVAQVHPLADAEAALAAASGTRAPLRVGLVPN